MQLWLMWMPLKLALNSLVIYSSKLKTIVNSLLLTSTARSFKAHLNKASIFWIAAWLAPWDGFFNLAWCFSFYCFFVIPFNIGMTSLITIIFLFFLLLTVSVFLEFSWLLFSFFFSWDQWETNFMHQRTRKWYHEKLNNYKV